MFPELTECKLCPLYKTRTKICQGSGNINSKILIVGEAPGGMEDKVGKPFIGRSGILLDMWLATLKLDRTKVYIYNTVQCIPLTNNKIRPPTDEELFACRHNLQTLITEMKPEVIITLGKTALKYFKQSDFSMSNEVGNKVVMDGNFFFPLYHPSYFLRGNKSWISQLTCLYKHLNGEELKNPDDNSILYYDLETTSLEPNTGRIKCIGYYSDKYEKGEIITNIIQFQTILDDHQFHVGYNTKEFDNPYLNHNGIFPRGKQLDLIEIMKKKNPVLKKKCISFSLNEVCRVHNLGQKKDIPLKILLSEHNTEEETKLIHEYCMHDVMLTRSLFKFINKKMEYVGSLMSQQDRMNYRYLTCGTGSVGYKIICNKLGLKENYDSNAIKINYEGARVIQPRQSIYININGYIVDFCSDYPHAVMEHNLGVPCKKTNCKLDWKSCEYCSHGNKLYTLFGYYCIKKFGETEQLLKDIFLQRIVFKKEKNPNEYGCKIASNAIYGAIANPVFESVYNFDSGQDITLVGRERHKHGEKRLKEAGYDVIFGDTDSFAVIDSFNNINKLKSVIDIIMKELQEIVPFPQPTFKLEIENKIKAIYFIENKKKDKLNKKHYMYITDDNQLIIKGISLVKLTATRLAKEVFEMIKPSIIRKQQFRFKKSSIDGMIMSYLKEDITSIATTKRVREPDSYASPTSLPSQIAQKYGAGNHKLIKNFKIAFHT